MNVRYHVSSTEHSPELRSLAHTYSTVPERHGCDVLAITPTARIGYQRKETVDFFASLSDGRLSKELLQISSSSVLTCAVLIIEGSLAWTTDGQSTIPYVNITLNAYRSILTSLQLQSIIVHHTLNPSDTVQLITSLTQYLSKPTHSSLSRRPNAHDQWGRKTSRSFGTHLLQSFPTVGPELAQRIYDYFSTIPLEWTCDESQLQQIPGIGAKKAAQLIDYLR